MNARSVIGVGSAPNDGTGDPLRQAFQKANRNFQDLFPLEGSLNIYASPTGVDSNDGLTVGTPVTIREAVFRASRVRSNVIGFGVFNSVFVNLADGTYLLPEPLVLPSGATGDGRHRIVGNAAAPSNVVIRYAGAQTRVIEVNGAWLIQGLRIEYTGSSGSAALLRCALGSDLNLANIVFGQNVTTGYNILTFGCHSITLSGSLADIGSRTIAAFILADRGSRLFPSTHAIAVPSLTFADFAIITNASLMVTSGLTFTGSATGRRYTVNSNSLINTFGGGANYFPGNAAGSAATQGLYL